ncbi:hypothetical protein TNCT_427751 [Trichonephila clavata]|uniref:Uncharacterized protein n=1 Tax=Trichonephila clavata TaxID=2740835 RepID=A0A8X6GB18_TRICU|nr:hypothetical protein TNCT_427751 [Trichonephila clavata]
MGTGTNDVSFPTNVVEWQEKHIARASSTQSPLSRGTPLPLLGRLRNPWWEKGGLHPTFPYLTEHLISYVKYWAETFSPQKKEVTIKWSIC